jgi:mannose-6-phosphate isomerase
MTSPLHPLRFSPILRQYIWGGRRLGTLLGKSLGPEAHYAESWEICDHGADQSIVESGPLAGATLGQLVGRRGEALLGQHHPQLRFPLLWKFLDAAQTLSVQVHPDDAQAARLDPPDMGKTEAWVIVAAEPGSRIYAGLKPGVDRAHLAAAVQQGTVEACLHSFEAQPGDCVFLPAGTIHALGQGLLVAEIQQASDVTYRLFDWNRLGADGKPRPLHVQQALAAIDYSRGPVEPQQPKPMSRPALSRLVECPQFTLDRWQLTSPQTVGGDGRCHILAVLEGTIAVERDPAKDVLASGHTMLLPAVLGEVELRPDGRTVLLDAYLP